MFACLLLLVEFLGAFRRDDRQEGNRTIRAEPAEVVLPGQTRRHGDPVVLADPVLFGVGHSSLDSLGKIITIDIVPNVTKKIPIIGKKSSTVGIITGVVQYITCGFDHT